MILGVRSVVSDFFTGMNVFLLRDWTQPVDQWGLTVFRAFDESLARLRTDKDATRVVPLDPAELAGTNMNTATEAALRSLPERLRASAGLYTLAVQADFEMRRKVIWSSLPRWVHVHIENAAGDLHHIKLAAGGWRNFALEENDLFVHASLFSENFVPRLIETPRPRFLRLSRVIEESVLSDLTPSLSVPIFPQDQI